jgi:hypothetical protein
MELFRQAVLYLVLVGAFYGGVLAMKSLARVQVPSGYNDVRDLVEYGSYRVDGTVPLTGWRPGDAVCWRLGPDADQAVNFGWIAGLPGDRVQVQGGHLVVNGHPFQRGETILLPDCGPVVVPASHVFVLNDRHQGDSIGQGPLPVSALRGRLESLP